MSNYGPCYYMLEDQHEDTHNPKPGWMWDEKWIVGLENEPQPDQQEFLEMLL